MNTEEILKARSHSKCELCGVADGLNVYEVPPRITGNASECIYACEICREQITNPEKVEVDHWRCLNDSMWNSEPAVQVVVWRMLNRLRSENWPIDLLDMLYLDEDTLNWAQAGSEEIKTNEPAVHLDSNGSQLQAGDTVVLIKDLKVKGANFVAKRGTAVRRISLVGDNPEHIEGRVNDQQIVILTKFVKKSK